MRSTSNPRPEDVPAVPVVVNQAGAGVAGGEGGGDGGDAGVGGVAPIQQPPLVPVQQPVPPGPTPGEVWDEKSEKIYMYLLLYTEGAAKNTVSQFRGSRNGVAAWRALRQRYDPQGVLGRSLLNRQLMEAKLEPHGEPDEYFLKVERITTRLEELDQPFGEGALVGLILSKLPKSTYGPLITQLYMDEELPYDVIKQRIRIFYQRNIAGGGYDDAAEDASKAFMAEGERKDDWKSKIKCYKCKKVGHVRRDCTSKKGTSTKPQNLGTKGSPKAAWKGIKQQQGKGTRKVKFDHKTAAGTTDDYDSDEEADEKKQGAFTATSKNPFWNDDKGEALLTFIVDSGATCHMVYDARYVSNVRYIDRSITVGGGRTLASIGTGNLEVLAKDNQGRIWPIIVHDVLIVPDLGINLLSVAKLKQKGADISFDLEKPHISLGSKRTALIFRDGLYRWVVKPKYGSGDMPLAYVSVSSDLAHERLGHIGS